MLQSAGIRHSVDRIHALARAALIAIVWGILAGTSASLAQERPNEADAEQGMEKRPDRPAGSQNTSQPPHRSFRENASLPFDSQLLKRFETVNDLLADERWTEAIAILQEIAQSENKGLVRLQPGVAGGVATYLNVSSRCNVLLSRIPEAGRQSYRSKFDPQAKRWYENWQRTRDAGELQRIVHQFFMSSYGDDALLALGEAAWDRGEFSAARSWWEQLVPLPEKVDPLNYPSVLRYPDADLDQPTILARIVMCSILEQDLYRATEELRQFTERYPTSEGWLAGERVILANRLKNLLEESQTWVPNSKTGTVETFAMTPTRSWNSPETVDVGSLRWLRPLKPNLLRRPVDPFPFQFEPLSYFPVVYENTVLVNDSDSIRAWNLLTGEPAWRSSGDDPAVIYPSVPDEQNEIPDRVSVGIPYYTMTISAGRLYARMGSPVNCPSNQQSRELTSDLVCLDLTQEGKLVWKIASRELFAEEGWRFEGSPVVVGGRAYFAVCRRHPQLELMVVCLDSSSGRLLWRTPVGGFRSSVDESANRVSHLLLTAGGGRLFLSTDVGAIIALNDQDGRLEWAVTYESRTNDSAIVLSDPSRKGLLPPMFHRGLLFVAPNDADFAYCIQADSGQILWKFHYLTSSPNQISELERRELETRQRRENQWHHILGVAEGGAAGRLIVSGTSLWAIDINEGTRVWTTSSPRVTGTGRGLLTSDQILVPGRDSIDFVSQKTGDLVRRVPLRTPDSAQLGGNLTLANGILLVAQSNRLSAYCEYSILRQRIERELTQQPDNTSIQLQLAEIEAAEGSIEQAATEYGAILTRGNRSDPNVPLARRKLTQLLQSAGQAAFDKSDLASARDYWSRAKEVAEDITDRIQLRFDLARVEEALGDIEAALTSLQSLLNDEMLAEHPREFRTAGQDAIDRMAALIDVHGRVPYREIEAEAVRKLEELKDSPRTAEIQWLIQSYPHAEVTLEARRLLAQIHQDAGEISQAYALLNEFRRDATDDQTLAQSTVAMIDLVDAGKLETAESRLRKSLSHLDPSITITSRGKTSSLGEFLSAKKRASDSLGQLPFFLERNWSRPVTTETKVVVPQDVPPSPEFASILLCEQRRKTRNDWVWRCLDSRTGKVRWEEHAPHAAVMACWTNTHLLIGTPYGWEARVPETGRRIWNETSFIQSTPYILGESLDVSTSGKFPAQFDVDRGLRIIDPDDGQLVATLKPPGRLHAFHNIGSVIVPARANPDASPNNDGAGPRDGEGQTSLTPQRSLAVIMETTKPTRTWLATAPSPDERWEVSQIPVAGEPWQSTPVSMRGRIMGINQQFHLVCQKTEQSQVSHPTTPVAASSQAEQMIAEEVFIRRRNSRIRETSGLDDLSSLYVWRQLDPTPATTGLPTTETRQNDWEYRNFSIGNAYPVLWPHPTELTVIADGSSLFCFDPVNGRRKWSTGIADFPVEQPDRQITGGPNTLYAASQGTLRSVSLTSGEVRFECYLGDVSTQWRTALIWPPRGHPGPDQTLPEDAAEPLNFETIATWPIGTKSDEPRRLLICSGQTGEVVQSLVVDSEPREILFTPEGRGILWTEKTVNGLQGKSSVSEE
ncbi:outer membrane protein assembly factor BamB family protein [Schlesneria sp.]|uniref:outer membrane protein assembly factor BamB family protein n=1 Tax=Schlesneria sp. TaxID=2762018 RepID=UPI002EE0CFB4